MFQVSKCEKYGYGYMLSQVAATAPGIVALQNTGTFNSAPGSHKPSKRLHFVLFDFFTFDFNQCYNNNNNSIYLYIAISPELKCCSEALVTTLA